MVKRVDTAMKAFLSLLWEPKQSFQLENEKET